MYKTGAYRVVNTVNNKGYVGGAYKSFESRWALHRRDLNQGKHKNKHLQWAWNKYGESSFKFEILQRCKPDRKTIMACEQKWINKLNVCNRKFGYNKCPVVESRLGTKHSKASIEKLVKTMSVAKHKIAETRKNNPPSLEAREKMGAANRGKKRKPPTADSRSKMSEAAKAQWDDPIKGKARREAVGSEESRAKNSEAIKAAWADPETRARYMAYCTSEEHRAVSYAANKGHKVSRETRGKISRSLILRNRRLKKEKQRSSK